MAGPKWNVYPQNSNRRVHKIKLIGMNVSEEKSQSLADKLNAIGSMIAELTSKVSASTKSAIS